MASNKNTVYTKALVSFLLDTKPYSRKLTEINEIYKLDESISVSFSDELFTGATLKSAWPYSFFSSGSSSLQPLKFQRISNYQDYGKYVNNQQLLSRGAFKIGRDESVSLSMIPNTYDPKSLSGIGLKDCYVQKEGNPVDVQYLIEGIDHFLSKGSYSFQVKQITGSNVSGTIIKTYDDLDGPFPTDVEITFEYDELILLGPVIQVDSNTIRVTNPGEIKVYGTINGGAYSPQFTELRNEAIISAAQQAAANAAYDLDNPNSAINQISSIMDAIDAQLTITPNTEAQREVDSIFSILETPKLPYSYADLIGALINASTPVISGYASWNNVSLKLESLSPRILFNDFTDMSLRESGKLNYVDIVDDTIQITNIDPNIDRENYEEFTVTAISDTQLLVSGSLSGNIGLAELGSRFESDYLNFDVSAGTNLLVVGSKFVLTPSAKITVSKNTTAQSWSVIKTNPIAYSRPVYASPTNAYAKIISLDAKEGQITFLDQDFPSGKLELEVISATQARMYCENEPTYSPLITFNTVFNDGRLGFTVVNGTFAPLQIGDRILMRVLNLPPNVEGLDLYFGYDVDAYDANNLVYNNVSSAIENYLTTIDFGFDSRFIGYDLATFNLVIDDNAVSNRAWRLRALADLSKPLLMPSGIVNLLGTDDPTNPTAFAKYDSDNDATSEGIQSSTDFDDLDDLQLWYANRFALEYQDGEAGIWQTVNANIQVNQRYTFSEYGIAFTVVPAAKPFIASRSTSTQYVNTSGGLVTSVVDGGDIIYFKIVNPEPKLENPASILSNTPRMIMYGEHFHKCPSANWVVTKVAGGFTLQGKYSSNNINVYSTPLFLSSEDGLSYHIKENSLHFTIVEGRGMAVGDTFTFTTFENHASFLVYGSVTGWTAPARLNTWYWNGHIGFKIRAAQCELFVDGELQSTNATSWVTSYGNIELDYLKEDLSDSIINFQSLGNGTWLAYRNGNLLGSGVNEIVIDEFGITLPNAPESTNISMKILGATQDFALGQDLVILNRSSERFPDNGDFLVIERIDTDDMQLAIKSLDVSHFNDLRNLGAQTIDIRFTGSTNSTTSPELNTLSNWIPLTKKFIGPSGNEVPFGAVSTSVEISSPFTLEKIAEIKSIGNNLNEDVYVFWDADFYESYLPLNAESIVLARSAGMNEKVNVSLTETINFLTSAPGLNESSLFADTVFVNIQELAQWFVGMNYSDAINIAAVDGPFDGFLPGFDNLPYDYETLIGDLNGEGGGYYDAGQPLLAAFDRAKELSNLSTISPQEQLELNTLIGVVNPYLVDGSLANTSIGEFITAIDSDDAINFNLTNQGFGFPNVGLATHIKENSTSSASSSIFDVMTLISRNPGTAYDARGYDIGMYDEPASSTTIISSSKDDLYKSLPVGISFNEFETDLYAIADTESIELNFNSDVNGYPDIFIWENSWSKPVKAYYQKLSNRQITMSVPSAGEVKIATLASPAELFANNNEIGAWYDPSDVSTLFQDSAGTIPVTAIEQPVGLMLDKSRGGITNQGSQKYNLLSFTDNPTAIGWTRDSVTAQISQIESPFSTGAIYKVNENIGTALHRFYRSVSVSTATTYTSTSIVKAGEKTRVMQTMAHSSSTRAFLGTFDLSTGTVVSLTYEGTGSGGSANIKDLGDGWYQISVTGSMNAATIFAGIRLVGPDGTSTTYAGDGVSGIFFAGIDLRITEYVNNLPQYQVIGANWTDTIPGNHATQSTSASRPVLSARVNLLTKTEQFNDAAWVKSAVSVVGNAALAPDGTSTADLVYPSSSGTGRVIYQTFALTAGSYKTSFALKAAGKQWAAIDGTNTTAAAYFDLQNGLVGTVAAGHTASILPLGGGWYRCTVENTAAGGAAFFAVRTVDANGSASVTTNGTDGIYIWGADLRVANDGVGLPAYQRVNTSTDYDTTGFPMYLRFDGVDDGMVTNSINFTSTDKMTVWAGVRKLSDAATSIIYELSAEETVNNGSMVAYAPITTSEYSIRSRGTAAAVSQNRAIVDSAQYAAPITNVFSAIHSIALDNTVLRLNGAQAAQSNGDQGAGNFGNYPLYIGRRGGTTLSFNGRIYSLVIRGAQSSEEEITTIESWVNQRTKALPSL
jgi:hypothetical protein